MRNDYKILKKRITQIVNDYDPAGLLAAGSPSDEYEAEIDKILILLKQKKDKIQLNTGLMLIFNQAFGEHTCFDQHKLNLLASDLQGFTE